ncbi:hypothetical protein Tco_1471746 [Tanacetum coccineum]
MFSRFMFFEAEESMEISLGTWNINIVDETLHSSDNLNGTWNINIVDETLYSSDNLNGTWNINIVDETLHSSDNVNGMEKVEDFVDENSLADLNDLNDLKETINELARNEIQHLISKENMDQDHDINKVSFEL